MVPVGVDTLSQWSNGERQRGGGGVQRDRWALQAFPHRLQAELKEELRDKIRNGQVRGETECVDWLQEEERVDALNQKMDDLWNIPLVLERG